MGEFERVLEAKMTTESATGLENSPKASRRRLSREERRRLAAENELEWLAFPGLPGTHLTWRKGGSGSWDLVSASGAVWVTRRRQSITVSGRSYEIRHVWKNKRRNYIFDRLDRQELVDATGSVVFSWKGTHFSGRAGTVLTLRGTDYAFPIRGSVNKAKTVMSAVEIGGSGQSLAWFRLTCGSFRARNQWRTWNPGPVEVVVSPESLSTHQMALLIAVATSWIRSYFDTPGGG